MKITGNLFVNMISLEHLFQCWDNFKRGKQKRKDIQFFERHLEDNIFQIHEELKNGEFQHLHYENFPVTDPKPRLISKATVRDRLVHHMVYEVLTKIFDKSFIFHSLASRKGKGIHFGVDHLHRMIRKVSSNGTKSCFALKMDVKRFFDSVDHEILKTLIRKQIEDEKTLQLIDTIIDSFSKGLDEKLGIPLGNVTSQLFANIYLHPLDDFVKQTLRKKFYLRYCDDFIILSEDKNHLHSLISTIHKFLKNALKLELHPNKVSIRKLSQGIDFIGYNLFAHHTLLRNKTKRRMKKRLQQTHDAYLSGSLRETTVDQTLQSYLGILSHTHERTLITALKNSYWVGD